MTAILDTAETTLAELLKQVAQGDTVTLVSGEERTPVAVVTPVAPPLPNSMRISFMKHLDAKIPEGFFDPLPDEELLLWEDGGPDDPLNWSEERIRQANAAADAAWK